MNPSGSGAVCPNGCVFPWCPGRTAVSRNLCNSLSSHFRPLPGPHWPGVKPAFWGGQASPRLRAAPGTRRSSRGAPGAGGTMPGLPRPRWATGGTWRGSPGAGGGGAATPAPMGQPRCAPRWRWASGTWRGAGGPAASGREVRRRLAGPPGARPGERSAASPLSVLPEAAGYCLTSPPTSPFAQGIDRLVGAGPLSCRHPANLISSQHMVYSLGGSRGPHTHTNNRRVPGRLSPRARPHPRPRPRPRARGQLPRLGKCGPDAAAGRAGDLRPEMRRPPRC